MEATRRADMSLLVPSAVIAVVVWFWLDAMALSYLFTRFNVPLPGREARSVRALTYLLAMVNWNLGSGGIVLHLRRSKGVPLVEGVSTMFYYGLIDGIVLSSLALVGLMMLPSTYEFMTLEAAAAFLVFAQAATLVFFLSSWRPNWRWAKRLADLGIFRTHGLAGALDALLLLGVRLVYFAGFIAFFWVTLPAFGATVPLARLIATVPVVLLIGAIPITPAGLGTQQAAMLHFYRPYAPEGAVLAFGLLFPVIFTLARVPLALLYVRDLSALRSSIRAAE
jgi:uncharacterized membrane protein YbhN (UPF0104 family)